VAYSVSYRETVDTAEADHNALMDVPTEDVELEEVIEICQMYQVSAELSDAQGFQQGWVHADGKSCIWA
jgi:hypothetical protein